MNNRPKPFLDLGDVHSVSTMVVHFDGIDPVIYHDGYLSCRGTVGLRGSGKSVATDLRNSANVEEAKCRAVKPHSFNNVIKKQCKCTHRVYWNMQNGPVRDESGCISCLHETENEEVS